MTNFTQPESTTSNSNEKPKAGGFVPRSEDYVPRPRLQAKEHEILRISASLGGSQPDNSLQIARTAVLNWAQNRSVGQFPEPAWNHQSFDHLGGGRDCYAVRLTEKGEDTWVLRSVDPDKGIPGRIWTTEIAVLKDSEQSARFTLRLVAGSTEPEVKLDDGPHVPGVVLQLIQSPGLSSGNFRRLGSKPVVIGSEEAVQLLIDALLDPARKLPVIVLSVPSTSSDPAKPLLDATTLAKACSGLALVVVIPAKYSWALTERFGKKLSTYEGAARVYLPGFTEDANPFGGHELILPQWFSQPQQAKEVLARLRWAAATGSVRRLQLGTDVFSFAPFRVKQLEQKQLELSATGASEKEQLAAAQTTIDLLEQQLNEKEQWEKYLYRIAAEAEERAETAEKRANLSGFRVQQLEAQITSRGGSPDESVRIPTSWGEFSNWCDEELAGRIILTPQARKSVRSADFENVELAGRCLLWLANAFRRLKLEGTEGSLRDQSVSSGIINAHCGMDAFDIEWQGKKRHVDWHIKNGGNTHDPKRCLRIYYFWDEASLQTVIASMPTHRRTEAT